MSDSKKPHYDGSARLAAIERRRSSRPDPDDHAAVADATLLEMWDITYACKDPNTDITGLSLKWYAARDQYRASRHRAGFKRGAVGDIGRAGELVPDVTEPDLPARLRVF